LVTKLLDSSLKNEKVTEIVMNKQIGANPFFEKGKWIRPGLVFKASKRLLSLMLKRSSYLRSGLEGHQELMTGQNEMMHTGTIAERFRRPINFFCLDEKTFSNNNYSRY